MAPHRSDRRTFLANGARASAAVAVGSLPVAGPGSTPLPFHVADTSGSGSAPGAAAGPPTRLTLNGVENPVGVDPDDVHFAWGLDDPRRSARQGAYRIVVSTPERGRAPRTVWDSGQVTSARQAFVGYGGRRLAADTEYRWRVSTRDGGSTWSPFSEPAPFVTGLRAGDWGSLWLQPAASDPQPDRHTYLRTHRMLPYKSIERATAFVAAAHKYQLWVNGTEVDTGPSFSYPDEQYYQATDVTGHLRPGHWNAVGVLHHWYGAGQGRPESAPGLLVHLAVHFTDGTREVVSSDRSWREHPGEWLPGGYRNTDGADFVENIDGRATPVGWAEGDFDDRHWTSPAVLGPVGTAPFSRLVALRTRIIEHPVVPVSVRTLSTGAVVVDFGKIYPARPVVNFLHGVSGRTVPMHVGYLLDSDGHVSTVHGTQGTDLSFTYIQRDGAQAFRPYTYLGFRYLQIDQPGEHLGHSQITAMARHAAMPNVSPATFVSTTPMLNRVWDLTNRSALYTSQEQFIDTPTREKGPFLWDGSNESQVAMRAFGEQNLTWQALRDFSRSQKRYWPDGRVNAVYPNGDGARDFATFTEMYPEWVWQYYLNTGDLDTVASLLPTLENISDYLYRSVDAATGLISGLALGSNGDPIYGYDLATSADTTINVMGVNAFNRIGQIAELLGDPAQGAVQAGRRAGLVAAVNSRLVRADGVYVDGLHPDGTLSPHASQQVNAAALAYGVVPAARVKTVGAYIAGLGISVSPDHGLELLRGLHAAGLDQDLVDILTNTGIPGWAHTVAAGGTFTWETWVPSDDIGDGMSHGWGSCALVAMQEVLLGVTPLPPAAADGTPVLDVTPPPGTLTVSGEVPTVAGTVSVRWHRAGKVAELDLVLPPNVSAHVHMPGTRAEDITEGGRRLSPGAAVADPGTGRVTIPVPAGSFSFRSTGA
ncbi:MAG TPA: family 78 glycoside hydrolase catalytic domain [Acidimicrobiales bacterium]|nr:family 78 glycoside hydrolase catalytic domain [Acidimicrobiales bacterium]